MAKDIRTIKLDEGLGDVKFGADRASVKLILGTPDEVDLQENSEEEEDKTETFHYDDLEISLSFDEIDDWMLTSIATSSTEAVLGGKHLIGLRKEDFLKEAEGMDLGDKHEEDVSEDMGENSWLISFEESGINFWFEDEVLSEIQWTKIWDEE